MFFFGTSAVFAGELALYAKILGVNPIEPRAARFYLSVVFYSRCEFRTAYLFPHWAHQKIDAQGTG